MKDFTVTAGDYAKLGTLQKVIEKARHDGDAASVFCFGSTPEDTVGALVVVKGNQAFKTLRDLLTVAGLITMEAIGKLAGAKDSQDESEVDE